MPQVSADVHVPIPPELAFAVAQTTGEVRHRWDPFIREQRFEAAAQRLRTRLRSDGHGEHVPGPGALPA